MGPDFLNRRSKKAGYSVDPHSIHNLNSDVLKVSTYEGCTGYPAFFISGIRFRSPAVRISGRIYD